MGFQQTKNFTQVEAKADHFAHVNDEKFHMLWEMNKDRTLAVLKRILDTDKILYEQQMGLDWDPPQNFVVDKKALQSYKLALNNVPAEFLHGKNSIYCCRPMNIGHENSFLFYVNFCRHRWQVCRIEICRTNTVRPNHLPR